MMETRTWRDDEEGVIGIAVRLDGLWVWDRFNPQSREQELPACDAFRLAHWQDRLQDTELFMELVRLREVGLIELDEYGHLLSVAIRIHSDMVHRKVKERNKRKPNLWEKIMGLRDDEELVDEYLRNIAKEMDE
jgi:hypothetical protein